MPLKRTPPKKTNISETDSESIGGSVSDLQNTDNNSNINLGRLKRKRENEFLTFMEEVRNIISSFTSEQSNKLETLEYSLSVIKSQNNTLQLSMETLSHKYDDIQKELEGLRNERKEYITYIKQLENKIENLERAACSTKIEVRNIPKIQNENKHELFNTVKKIGNILNLQIESGDIKDIYRNTAKSNISKPIVVEFTSVLTKESIIQNLKKLTPKEKNEKLNTTFLGFDSTQKQLIYISEALTPKGRRLFYLARDFAKSHSFSYCWTSYGKIFLRKKEGLPQIRIQEEGDLLKLKEKSAL